ncbi:MAG: AAA family ATPase [Planctomycetes bacterium]|nr:AAA family ATPase [Planctomycetota bacterium]
MLDRVEIMNYRCFAHVDVPLRPFTVLIGPNDTGKSSFLSALRLLTTDGMNTGDVRRGARAALVQALWRGQAITAEVARGESERRSGPVNEVFPTRLFSLPSAGVSMTSKGTPAGVPALDQTGSNLAALVDYLLRKDRRRFDAFVAAMRALVPGLEEINIETPSPDTRQLEFVIDGGLRIPGDRASAGVKLLLFFVALAHHPELPKIVLIEEPANGLHPKRIADVVQLLRGLTTGALGGPPAQVIVTTHSPLLVDELDLEQDQLLVFERQPDGARTARPVDRDRLRLFLDEFKLGEVWFNRDEEGLVAPAEPRP